MERRCDVLDRTVTPLKATPKSTARDRTALAGTSSSSCAKIDLRCRLQDASIHCFLPRADLDDARAGAEGNDFVDRRINGIHKVSSRWRFAADLHLPDIHTQGCPRECERSFCSEGSGRDLHQSNQPRSRTTLSPIRSIQVRTSLSSIRFREIQREESASRFTDELVVESANRREVGRRAAASRRDEGRTDCGRRPRACPVSNEPGPRRSISWVGFPAFLAATLADHMKT